MNSPTRANQFVKVHKVLKKHYKASPANAERSVIEHLLFACCLEDAHHDAAEEAFAALVHTFFDWNEVRVTSISELSEVMARLPDPRAAANRIKRVLHAVFEAMFNFDLESMKKKNLGPTVKWFEKLDGATHFTVAYITQAALGGHAIPVDAGALAVLRVLNLVTDKDVTDRSVPGLERAVAKSKGVEFFDLLHELGADYSANPYAPGVREILLRIDPDCESRLPKRRADRPAKKEKPATDSPAKADKPAKPAVSATSAGQSNSKSNGTPTAQKTTRKKTAVADTTAAPPPSEPAKKKSPSPKSPAQKPTAQKSAPPETSPRESAPQEPATQPSPPPELPPESDAAEKTLPRATASKKRPASEGLSKRKPR